MKNILKCFAWIGVAIISIVLAAIASVFITKSLFHMTTLGMEGLFFAIVIGTAIVGIFPLCLHALHMKFSKNVIKPEKLKPKDFIFLLLVGCVIGILSSAIPNMFNPIGEIEFMLDGVILALACLIGITSLYAVVVLHGISGTLFRKSLLAGFVTSMCISIPMIMLMLINEIMLMLLCTIVMVIMNIIYLKYKNIYCVIFAMAASLLIAFAYLPWLQCLLSIMSTIAFVIFIMKNPEYTKISFKK